MSPKILDGKKLAQTIQGEIAAGVDELVKEHGIRPGLAMVQVGVSTANGLYVRGKRKACAQVGMTSFAHELPADISQSDLLGLIGQLNADPAVHGIVVQHPLSHRFDEAAIVNAIAPHKDVEGLGAENLSLLTVGRPRYIACTPHGIQQLLLCNRIEVAGAHVVIVGRSNFVCKPLALLLVEKDADATVTLCHSATPDLTALTRHADVIVMALGKARMLTAVMVKRGAVVIDVGTHRLEDGSLAGDVDFESVGKVASAISPVPGGVGPMTITMLLYNTLKAARDSKRGPCSQPF